MTYYDLIQDAENKLHFNKITLGEYEEMIKPLKREIEQEPCGDCVSRAKVKSILHNTMFDNAHHDRVYKVLGLVRKQVDNLSTVQPKQKVGRWILSQRGNFVDIVCSECGYRRVEEYAYNYTVDEIDEKMALLIMYNQNFCECCGAKMEGVSK